MIKKKVWESYYQLHQDDIENQYLRMDEEYMRLENELQGYKREIEVELRKSNAELWKKYDEMSTTYNNLEAYLIRMMYIRGMEDRDSLEK